MTTTSTGTVAPTPNSVVASDMRTEAYPLEEYAVVVEPYMSIIDPLLFDTTTTRCNFPFVVGLLPLEVSMKIQRARTVGDYSVTHDGKVYSIRADGKHTVAPVGCPNDKKKLIQLLHVWEVEGRQGSWTLLSAKAAFVAEYALAEGRHTAQVKCGRTMYSINVNVMLRMNMTTMTQQRIRKSRDLLTTGIEYVPPAAMRDLLAGCFGRDVNTVSRKFYFGKGQWFTPTHQREAIEALSRATSMVVAEEPSSVPPAAPIPNEDQPYIPVGYTRVPTLGGNWRSPDGDLDATTSKMRVCYHGTKMKYILPILSEGFRGNYCKVHVGNDVCAVYFSPSIEYSSHPRYAEWHKHTDGKYYQFILECRVHYDDMITGRQSLHCHDGGLIDPHFPDRDAHFEWVMPLAKGAHYTTERQVRITGLLIRCSSNPYMMLQRNWWVIPYQVGWVEEPKFTDIDTAKTACWKTVKDKTTGVCSIQHVCTAEACNCLAHDVPLPIKRISAK